MKLNSEVSEEGLKVWVSNWIPIFNNSIFVKFQPLNIYSKGVKRKYWLSNEKQYINLNYCKINITENLGTE